MIRPCTMTNSRCRVRWRSRCRSRCRSQLGHRCRSHSYVDFQLIRPSTMMNRCRIRCRVQWRDRYEVIVGLLLEPQSVTAPPHLDGGWPPASERPLPSHGALDELGPDVQLLGVQLANAVNKTDLLFSIGLSLLERSEALVSRNRRLIGTPVTSAAHITRSRQLPEEP